jgi:hypothetical protein
MLRGAWRGCLCLAPAFKTLKNLFRAPINDSELHGSPPRYASLLLRVRDGDEGRRWRRATCGLPLLLALPVRYIIIPLPRLVATRSFLPVSRLWLYRRGLLMAQTNMRHGVRTRYLHAFKHALPLLPCGTTCGGTTGLWCVRSLWWRRGGGKPGNSIHWLLIWLPTPAPLFVHWWHSDRLRHFMGIIAEGGTLVRMPLLVASCTTRVRHYGQRTA